MSVAWSNRKVVNISEHEHWANYAEPGPTPISIPKVKQHDYISLGVAILCVCTVVALAFVACEYNF